MYHAIKEEGIKKNHFNTMSKMRLGYTLSAFIQLNFVKVYKVLEIEHILEIDF